MGKVLCFLCTGGDRHPPTSRCVALDTVAWSSLHKPVLMILIVGDVPRILELARIMLDDDQFASRSTADQAARWPLCVEPRAYSIWFCWSSGRPGPSGLETLTGVREAELPYEVVALTGQTGRRTLPHDDELWGGCLNP